MTPRHARPPTVPRYWARAPGATVAPCRVSPPSSPTGHGRRFPVGPTRCVSDPHRRGHLADPVPLEERGSFTEDPARMRPRPVCQGPSSHCDDQPLAAASPPLVRQRYLSALAWRGHRQHEYGRPLGACRCGPPPSPASWVAGLARVAGAMTARVDVGLVEPRLYTYADETVNRDWLNGGADRRACSHGTYRQPAPAWPPRCPIRGGVPTAYTVNIERLHRGCGSPDRAASAAPRDWERAAGRG